MKALQVLVEIVRDQIMFRKYALFVKVLTILQKNVSKGLDRKKKKLARLMFHLTEIWNVRLRNDLDVDLNITLLQNVLSHQNIMRNGERKYVLMKKVIVHATTAKIKMTIRYRNLWHKCLAMTSAKVKSMVTVRN